MFLKTMKASEGGDRSVWGDFFFTQAPLRAGQVTSESSLQLSAVYACTRVLTDSIASLPFQMYRVEPDGSRVQQRDHWLYRLFAKRPNDYMNPFEFMETLTAHLVLRGNCFAQIVSNGRGEVTDLHPIHPDVVSIEMLSNSNWRYRVRNADGTETIYTRGDIFHVKGLSPNGIMGYNPIELARKMLSTGAAAQDYGLRYFENDASPSGGWIEHPNNFKDKDQKKNFRDAWQEAQGGKNKGKVAILEYGMKYHDGITIKNSDAQFIETKRMNRLEICSLFRVPPHKIADLDRATFCLPAGTDVLTTTGPKVIEDVREGDVVWSRSGDEWVSANVTRSECSGSDPILLIRTSNRTLRANAKHRILTRRKVADPQPGQGGYQCSKWVDEYVAAGELRAGDTIIALDGGFINGTTQTPTRIASVGFMAFCGLLLADGNVNAGHGVTISRAGNAPHMNAYREIMIEEFQCYDGGNGRGDMSKVKRKKVKLDEGERYTRFASAIVAKELTDLGLSGTARTKRVPGWVFCMTEELRLSFIRGFVDGDGHVDKKGRISVSSCNRELLSDIRHLCMMSAIPVTNLRCQKGKTKLPNGKIIDFEQWTFTCSDPGKNARIGSYNPSDVKRVEDGAPFERKGRAYPRFGGKGKSLQGCSLSRITSITAQDAEPVYDLEIEGTHNFVADGVIVHNSNIEQQSIDFVVDCLRPWLVRWEEAIKYTFLDVDDDSLFVNFPVISLLRGDSAARSAYINMGIMNGTLTRNEARLMEDRNPLPGLDEPLRMLNMVTETEAKHTVDEQDDAKQAQNVIEPEDTQDDAPEQDVIDARMHALASAAADRVARKEVEMVAKAIKNDTLAENYARHADFVAGALAVDKQTAQAYCAAQIELAKAGGGIDYAQTRAKIMAIATGSTENSQADADITHIHEKIAQLEAKTDAIGAEKPEPQAVNVHVHMPEGMVKMSAPVIHNAVAAAPAPNIQLDVHVPQAAAPIVNVQAADQPAPVVNVAPPQVNVTNDVQPAPVTVNNAFASRAVQTVQRDANDEIVSTTTDYTP